MNAELQKLRHYLFLIRRKEERNNNGKRDVSLKNHWEMMKSCIEREIEDKYPIQFKKIQIYFKCRYEEKLNKIWHNLEV